MALSRYFMNVRYRDRLFVDEEGDELASEHAVHGHALDTARDLIAHAWMDSIRNWFDCSFEVTNEAGQVVLVMPFGETLNETGATRREGTDQGVVNEPDAL